jgi:hypothetical protein
VLQGYNDPPLAAITVLYLDVCAKAICINMKVMMALNVAAIAHDVLAKRKGWSTTLQNSESAVELNAKMSVDRASSGLQPWGECGNGK